mmetsp:Transcript_10482/g.30866  ORF Transcript_10482/g.30866 Transcript_10482/m.30866 type:complete len:208 (+) Transcript_10482:128-751(+)
MADGTTAVRTNWSPPSTPVISHAQASSAAARVRANCYRSLHTWTGTARRANPSEKGVPDLATPTARRQIRGRCGPCVGGAAPQHRSAQDSRRGRAEQQGPCADEALRLARRSVALRNEALSGALHRREAGWVVGRAAARGAGLAAEVERVGALESRRPELAARRVMAGEVARGRRRRRRRQRRLQRLRLRARARAAAAGGQSWSSSR